MDSRKETYCRVTVCCGICCLAVMRAWDWSGPELVCGQQPPSLKLM